MYQNLQHLIIQPGEGCWRELLQCGIIYLASSLLSLGTSLSHPVKSQHLANTQNELHPYRFTSPASSYLGFHTTLRLPIFLNLPKQSDFTLSTDPN